MTNPPPMAPQTKPRRVIVRLTEGEYQAYLKAVQSLSTTRSRMMRLMIREFVDAGPDFLPHDLKTLSQGVFQLGALGRNLNQQLRAMHSGQLAGQPADMDLVKAVREQTLVLEEEWLEAINRSKKRRVQP